MRKLVVLLVAVMVLGWVGVASSSTRYERTQYLYDKVDQFKTTGICSDNEAYSLWIDLNQISSSGSVTTSTYKDGITTPDIGSFTTSPRSFDYAVDKITRYILGNIANAYRAEPFNTETTMITSQRISIPVYVYGSYKTDVIDEILGGLPTCFDISYDTSHGHSDPVTPLPMPVMEKILAQFMLGKTTYTTAGETKIMDVTPETKNNVSYFPVRFLAYAIGIEDSGITWDATTYTATFTKGEITVKLTIGSKTMIINDKEVALDTAPYIKDGRTMLPPEPLARAFGVTTIYDEVTKTLTIKEQGQ